MGRYFKKIRPPEPKISTEHDLEAAGAAAFRSTVFERVGWFDETLGRGEDTDLTRRLRQLGIPVYYYPFQEIRHQYQRGCLDTILKNFSHGVHHYRLYRKYAEKWSVEAKVTAVLRGILNQFLRAIWEGRPSFCEAPAVRVTRFGT